MKEKALVIAILIVWLGGESYSQIPDYHVFRLYGLHNAFNNPDLPGNDGESRFSISMDAVVGRYEQGQLQFNYRSPFVDDVVPEVVKLLNGTSGETEGETFLTSLIVGWLQLGYNVYSTDNLCISPGIMVGDFWYTASIAPNFRKPELRGIIEPSGWYGGLGPALYIDYKIPGTSSLVLHYESFFAFSRRWSESSGLEDDGNANPESEDPFFFNNRFELRYKSVFVGYRRTTMINQYDETAGLNNGHRSDLFFGFAF
ncbi:MAG: hypothetical protein AAF789_03895 [Bacteroidota bacterium]